MTTSDRERLQRSANRLKNVGITISTLALGLPVGGELDYLDDGTIGAALKARRVL